MKKVIVTGAPHSKSAEIFKGLKSRFPDIPFLSGPHEAVLTAQGNAKIQDADYEVISRKKSPIEYGRLVIAKAAEQLEEIDPVTGLVVIRGSLIDYLADEQRRTGYSNKNRKRETYRNTGNARIFQPPTAPELVRAIDNTAYSGVIYCDTDYNVVNKSARDQERNIGERLTSAYDRFGIEIERIPRDPDISTRVDLAVKALDHFMADAA